MSWPAWMMPRRICARVREQLEQRVAVAVADRPLQRRQVLGEAAEHLQHRLLVVEEDVAPHRRVGRGDAGEIAEAAGRVLDHLAVGDAAEVGGGVDDVVGDQMRHVAGDGEHQVVVLGVHQVDIRAHRDPQALELVDHRRVGCRRAASGCTSGRRTARRSPTSGPECSVPAIGWPGMKCTPAGTCGATIADHRALDRADVGQDRARFAMCGPMSAAIAP